MPFPTFLIGPALGTLNWMRKRHQARRKVKLTVHRAASVGALASFGTTATTISLTIENYYITVTNASRDRDIVVTHIWLETVPPVHVYDPGLPVRLPYSAPWETVVAVSDVPDGTSDADVFLAARCVITPDDKVIKSRERKNVPAFGRVPRG